MAKTIIVEEDSVVSYDLRLHNDNHKCYMQDNYPDLVIDNYVPIILSQMGKCVIDLSKQYLFGTIYLPQEMTEFQKNYMIEEINTFKNYVLYLEEYSLIDPIPMESLLEIIKEKTLVQKNKR